MVVGNAEHLHRDSVVIDGLNASWFFDDDILTRLGAGGVTAVNATLAALHSTVETMGLIGEMCHCLGVRIMQLTYNTENPSGYDCQAPEDKGLTGFGREVIAEMNRLGILLEVSHCGPRTTLEAIDFSRQPVAITHANAAAKAVKKIIGGNWSRRYGRVW